MGMMKYPTKTTERVSRAVARVLHTRGFNLRLSSGQRKAILFGPKRSAAQQIKRD